MNENINDDEIEVAKVVWTNGIALDENEESKTEMVTDSEPPSEDRPLRISLPVPEPDTALIEPDRIMIANAEVINTPAKGIDLPDPIPVELPMVYAPMQMIPNWRPYLPYPLTASTLFNLAMTVEANDPAHSALGFFYETRLKCECDLLIPRPIPFYYSAGFQKALMTRRGNPGFFTCNAIDVVLTFYLNDSTTRGFYEY